MCNTGRTLLAQASSSHVVSCKTLMISWISALIFSKVNLLFLSASSMPAPRLLLVATKIFIAEDRNIVMIVFGFQQPLRKISSSLDAKCFRCCRYLHKREWPKTVKELENKRHHKAQLMISISGFITSSHVIHYSYKNID